MAWTSPKTWAADELLTASDLNQYVRDNLSALYALTQGGGMKNLLHNGAMRVAQRGTSTAGITSGTGLYYTADRWGAYVVGVGTWTQSVENDAPTGSGFRKSLKMLITANNEATVGAADYVLVTQSIEGQNLQAIKKGTASAQQLTLSFWTKSNKTGTYIVELYDADNTRAVSATYTVAASATWEQQTVTFPADTTGAFDNDNAASLIVAWRLASGTDYTSGTLATTWASVTSANRAVGQTNLAASTNNYWMVTGCQLEVGSAATGFEHKNYDQELAECQRYYYRMTPAGANYVRFGQGQNYNTTTGDALITHPVTMRVAPTAIDVSSTASHYAVLSAAGGVIACSAVPAIATTHVATSMVTYTVASGLVAGNVSPLMSNATTSGYLGLTADL